MEQPTVNNIGYPFIKTSKGLFNPGNDTLSNARSKILNLVNTIPGERVISNNCKFGLDLISLLFESNLNAEVVKERVSSTIKYWIPEVTNTEVQVMNLEHSIQIGIVFAIGQSVDTIYLEYMINEE